jgi:hypothetical protein
VSPANQTIIVRLGKSEGDVQWAGLFDSLAKSLGKLP